MCVARGWVVGLFTTCLKTGQPTKLKEKFAGREINLLLTLRFQPIVQGRR
jgi:hypothetical protein